MPTDGQYSSCSSSSYSSDDDSYASVPCIVSSVLLQQLEAEMKGKVHSGVHIGDFVQQVWGLGSETIEKLLSMPVSLVHSEKEHYKQCGSKREAHRSFVTIAESLLQAARKELGEEPDETLGCSFWDRLNDSSTEHYGCRMPDFVALWTPIPPFCDVVPKLSLARIILEMNWKDSDDSEDGRDTPREMVCYPFPVDTAIGHEEREESNAPFDHTSDVLGAGDGVDNGGRRPQGDHPLRGRMLPLYASETLASGSRYYVTGLLVDGFYITVCYFDRFLVACTESFSFEDEPAKLALVLYASTRCGLVQAGFDPLCTSCSRSRVPDDDMFMHCRVPVKDVVGSYFEYPTAAVQDVNGQPSAPVCLLVVGVIRRPQELIGRAAAVYKVCRRLADGTFSEESSVYKVSWPLTTSVSEVDVVRLLKQKLPEEAHDHLPEFLWTITYTAEDLQLPWLRLGLNVDRGERILRGTLGGFYNQLWEAGSIDDFKTAWLDCVECLYVAHRMGETVHPGLSERDLMVSKLADGGVKGVVIGWEFDGDDTNRHRTSALPFMAYELVSDTTRPHWFRHTLESLFYILYWAVIHYNLENGERDTVVHSSLADWVSGDLEKNRLIKLFLTSFDWYTIGEVKKGVKPEFAELYMKWVCPLRLLITKARADHFLAVEDGEESDPVTWGGRLTFKKFMTAIKVEPRTWGIPGFLDDEE